MSRIGKSGLLVLCLGALLGGCGEDSEDSCNSDEKLENNVCVSDTGGDGDDAAAPVGVDPTGFGTVCTADTECTTNAPYCAKMPNAPSGYCTRQDCTVADPAAVCPATWTCLDLNAFSPGLGTMCRQPS